MIRMIAKLFIVTLVLTTFLSVGPVSAQPWAWVSSAGNDVNACTVAQPCQSIHRALAVAGTGGQVNCIDSPGINEGSNTIIQSATIDCAGALTGFVVSPEALAFSATNQVFKVRNLTFNGVNTLNIGIKVTGSGTLILENCVFENFSGTALDIEPSGAFNLVITNSRISNSAAGVVIKPTGSVTATFNGVTIVDNTGGGLKADATNGPIAVDISNSTISNNGGNGINAVGGTIYANLLNLSHNVIAKNGSAGVQANGAEAAALIDTTLLDNNTAGATSVVGGGRLLTYGNNHIVGSAGSGFTSTAPSQ
jgi:hypothetical protein